MISKDLDGGATEGDGRASAPVGPSVAMPLFSHILLQISYFKKSTREHEIHNYLSFGHLFVCDYL